MQMPNIYFKFHKLINSEKSGSHFKYMTLKKDSLIPSFLYKQCRVSSMDILAAFLKAIGLVASAFSVYHILNSPQFIQDFKDDDTMSATVFTTDTLPNDPRLMATIGNGYIATRVFSDTIFVSGVYNGRRREPSHRARVPSSAAMRWSLDSQDSLKTTYSLDVARGVFLARGEGDGFEIEELIYAHREKPQLLVVEIRVSNSRSEALKVNLANNRGNNSSDIEFRDVPKSEFPANSLEQTRAIYGEINTTEEETSDKVALAVVWTIIPETVVVEARTNRTFYFITAIVSSLNTVDYLASAFSFHQEATRNVEGLLKGHTEEWARLWKQSSIEVQGDLKLAQAVYASLYYILSSIRDSWPYGLSPGSLSSNDYWGHSFWDTETWMYPTLLMLHPNIARSLLLYRYQRMDTARENAASHNVTGTMFPWESAFTGCPVCPEEVYSNYEIHVNGDIGFATEQYWMATRDPDWLREVGIPLIRGLAEFWSSRVKYDKALNEYVINAVMCPDEYHSNVNNSVFTNAIAKRNLEFASAVVPSAPAIWSEIAQRMRVPFDTSFQYHPEYDGYELNVTVKQADAILLGFPLMYNMSRQVRANDLSIYEARTDPDGPAMTKAMFAVGWLELDDLAKASASFEESYKNVREPFKVWTEYPSGDGAVNFITGAGGFLQAVIFGYGGLRLNSEEIRLNPRLPDGSTKLLIRGIHYRGNIMDVTIGTSESEVVVTSRGIDARLLVLRVAERGPEYRLNVGETVIIPNGHVVIQIDEAVSS